MWNFITGILACKQRQRSHWSYYTLLKALLAVMFITPLAWTKVVIPISTTNIGFPVKLDKDENLGALDVMKIMEEATKFTKEPKAQGECRNEKVDCLTTL